ncbi:hypothetical protein F2P81_000416 [Scophthalmus maximus]|uniref:Glucagon / GIP / secretin / VIP family domain-containing protein n=1 Tax=Scophthalmus maximus TaxID=52904 RepID=A0A6A4TL40_SCOMX|nr:hypothetical protein F2P81_000416 [Scophthalmus maximus]
MEDESEPLSKRHSDGIFTDSYSRYRKQMAVQKYLAAVLGRRKSYLEHNVRVTAARKRVDFKELGADAKKHAVRNGEQILPQNAGSKSYSLQCDYFSMASIFHSVSHIVVSNRVCEELCSGASTARLIPQRTTCSFVGEHKGENWRESNGACFT